ncbi:MAG: aminoacyl-tRNA hydrolase [Candidatus Omnitrophota bacterium]
MKILIGLGNPGIAYKDTRHNIGFRIIDNFAQRHKFLLKKRKFRSIILEGNSCNQKVLLVKAQTFMNLSGEAVRAVVSFYKIVLEEMLVICDDSALPLGKIRLRKKGSAGGHKGIISIIENIHSNNFPRLRVGIGRPRDRNMTNYVLQPFEKEEKKTVETAINLATDAIELWIELGITEVMNTYN